MNTDIAWGRVLQIAGMVWQFWGSLTGNEIRRTHGYQLVVVGQMRVLGARAAALARYCTPRQALSLQPAAVPHLTRPTSRIRAAGRVL